MGRFMNENDSKEFVDSVSLKYRVLSILVPIPIALAISNTEISFLTNYSPLLMALFICLCSQELLMSCWLYLDFNRDISRRLGNNYKLINISSIIGPLLTTLCVFFLPFAISAAIILPACIFTSFMSIFSVIEIIVIWITLSLLFDPMTSVIIESDFSDAVAICFGYMSIILVGVGAIPSASEGIIFQFLLCIALLNVRSAFLLEFVFKQRTGLTAFAPSIVALFLTMIPNLTKIMRHL